MFTGCWARSTHSSSPSRKRETSRSTGAGPTFGTTFLTFNVNPGVSPDTGEPYVAAHKLDWFGNVQFRQAVAHSIDKSTIIEDIQHGLGYPQWSSVSPSAGDFHNPDVRRYPYDIDKANAILDNLGWTDTDGDGIREDSDGNAIEFRLVTNTGNSVRQEVTQIIQQGMEALGLRVDYEAIDFGLLVGQLTSTYDWEAIVIGFHRGPRPLQRDHPLAQHRGPAPVVPQTSPSRPPTGKPRSTRCTCWEAKSWTTLGGCGTTSTPKRSRPPTCLSSTRLWVSG